VITCHCPTYLRRIPTITAIELASPEQYATLRGKQETDPDKAWIIKLVSEHGDQRPEGVKPESPTSRALYNQYENLRILEGMLFKEQEDEYGNVFQLYVLPASEVVTELDKLHNSVYGAHFGRKKTKRRVLERFYSPFLIPTIESYLRTCDL